MDQVYVTNPNAGKRVKINTHYPLEVNTIILTLILFLVGGMMTLFMNFFNAPTNNPLAFTILGIDLIIFVIAYSSLKTKKALGVGKRKATMKKIN